MRCSRVLLARSGTPYTGPSRQPNKPPLGITPQGTGEGSRRLKAASDTVIRRPMSKRLKNDSIARTAQSGVVDRGMDGHVETQRLIQELAEKRAKADVIRFQPTTKPEVPVGKPGTVGKASFWNSTIVQPINPQFVPAPTKPILPKQKPSRSARTSGAMLTKATHRLSDDQLETIVNHYAGTQWYGFIWRKISWIDINKMRGLRKWAHMGLITLCFWMFFVVYYCYFEECDLLSQLEEDELRDWNKIIWGMRMSEVKKVSDAVLEKADPLLVLPQKEQMSIVVQAFRDQGYMEKDFEMESRSQPSLLREPDFYHIFYWMVMYLGRALCGSTVAVWNYRAPV